MATKGDAKGGKAKGGGAKGGGDGDGEEVSGGGKKKMILIVAGAVILTIALGAGAFFMFLKPSDASAGEKEEPPPVPGAVLVLEPISVNLADGHYLRLGLSLQLIEGAEVKDGSKALDLAIKIFTQQKVEELLDAKHREEAREKLTKELEEAYPEKVMGVYFTEFVTQ